MANANSDSTVSKIVKSKKARASMQFGVHGGGVVLGYGMINDWTFDIGQWLLPSAPDSLWEAVAFVIIVLASGGLGALLDKFNFRKSASDS